MDWRSLRNVNPFFIAMKTLIIFNHPYEGSFCSAIRDAVKSGLRKGRHSCKVINLDKDRFDPVMREKDLRAFKLRGDEDLTIVDGVDPIVLRYKKKLVWAERIVMIFPIWWMSVPAMTKGFIDKVIFPGIAYKMEGNQLKSTLESLKQVVIISTMNTPAEVYSNEFNNSIEGSLIKGTFNKIGIHDIKWISLNMVSQSGDEKRWLWLDEIEKMFKEK